MQMSGDECKRIAWRAAIWLAILEENPSQEQRSAFLVWLEESPSHGEIFLGLAAQFPEVLESPGEAEPANEDMLPALSHLAKGYPAARPPSYVRKTPWARVTVFSLAIILTAPGIYWIWPRPAHQSQDSRLIFADAGTFQLGNNSTMTLDKQSVAEVQWRRDSAGIQVRLHGGHAAFAGEHNPSAPLRVLVNNFVVEPRGTSFDVYDVHDATTVKVARGKVHVFSYCQLNAGSAPASETDLEGGEFVKASAKYCGDPLIVRSVQDGTDRPQADSSEDWLDLNNETIQEAVQELNERGQHIVVSDPELGSQRISGNFLPSHVESFLEILRRDYHARVRRDTAPDGSEVIYLSLYARK